MREKSGDKKDNQFSEICVWDRELCIEFWFIISQWSDFWMGLGVIWWNLKFGWDTGSRIDNKLRNGGMKMIDLNSKKNGTLNLFARQATGEIWATKNIGPSTPLWSRHSAWTTWQWVVGGHRSDVDDLGVAMQSDGKWSSFQLSLFVIEIAVQSAQPCRMQRI